MEPRNKEAKMTQLTEDLKTAIGQIKPAMVATASKNGEPNVSPKGSFRVLDDQHLLLADLRSPQTIKNLKENPYLAAIGYDPSKGRGWRIWGKAVEILSSGNLYERLNQEYASKGGINHVVKIEVDKGFAF
jgi:predicted pyridoxine 5'-phosphate oxidase superfamily flavin-nucleotide-binding protein